MTETNAIYNAAEELYLAGLAVIPLGAKSKRPDGEALPKDEHGQPTWKPYQKRRADASERFAWFGDHAERNVGVVCGWVSGDGNGRSLVVLDFDEPGAYEAFARANLELVKSTWVVRSSKGYHVYLRAPGKVQTTKMPGGDLKGEGGYVVAPPSIHPDGPAYTWANRTPEIAEVDDLAALIQAETSERKAAEIPDRIPSGERNSTLTSLAGTMRRRGASTAEILAALQVANDERCDPPLPSTEVQGIAQSVGKYAPKAERPDIAGFFRGKTFIPKRLGEELKRRRPFRNITHVRSDGHLYSYADGVFGRNGDAVVERLTAEILGEAYRDNRRSETEAWLRATTYTDPYLANQHSGLVNVANGMLAWRTGELLAHDPKYLSTIQIPVEYDPLAKCPTVDDFLLTTLPPDCIDLALEWVGYCLLPTAKYCKAVMCVGPAANGKSTFLGLLGAFLGQDNTANIPLHELDEHRFKRAMLQDKLANLFSDLDQRALKQSGYFKLIVSGDPIDAERKHQHPFTFQPFCKLIFSANKMPASYDTSPAFYRRWLIIPFPNTFEGEACDPDMLEKITTPAELSGLLNKAIARLRTLEERRGFAEPGTVAEAMKNYKLTSDGMVAFLSECCRDAERGEWVGKKELYDAYTSWAEEAKVRYTESRADFNRRLQEFYPAIREDRETLDDGRRIRVWYNAPVMGDEKEAPEPKQEELTF